jgi:hypothetical protein
MNQFIERQHVARGKIACKRIERFGLGPSVKDDETVGRRATGNSFSVSITTIKLRRLA